MGFSVSKWKGDRGEKVRVVAKRKRNSKEIERDCYTVSIDVIGFGRLRLAEPVFDEFPYRSVKSDARILRSL